MLYTGRMSAVTLWLTPSNMLLSLLAAPAVNAERKTIVVNMEIICLKFLWFYIKRAGFAAGPVKDIGRIVSRFLFYPVIYLRSLPPGKERAALSVISRSFDSAGIFGLAGPGATIDVCRHTTL